MAKQKKSRTIEGDIISSSVRPKNQLSKARSGKIKKIGIYNPMPHRGSKRLLGFLLAMVIALLVTPIVFTMTVSPITTPASTTIDQKKSEGQKTNIAIITKSVAERNAIKMTKDEQPYSGPAAIFIAPGSVVKGLSITNSTSIGAPMLVADGATIEGLTMSINKVYGATQAVRLGDVFGANIDNLFLDTRLPADAIKEIVAAGVSSETRASFKDRMKTVFTDPAQLAAYYELVEKIWQAGKPLLGF